MTLLSLVSQGFHLCNPGEKIENVEIDKWDRASLSAQLSLIHPAQLWILRLEDFLETMPINASKNHSEI